MNTPTSASSRHLDPLSFDPLSQMIASEEIRVKAQRISSALLAQSPRITEADFSLIAASDLELLFRLYDAEYFGGMLTSQLASRNQKLRFRLSTRLYKSGGKLSFARVGESGASYELSIGVRLLFQSFMEVERTVVVNGLVCRNRLEALLRIFEHELVHLLEYMRWQVSDCEGRRFAALVKAIFGHTATRHQLVTQMERAKVLRGIAPGTLVAFRYRGATLAGRVLRITRRATVLVKDPSGELYSVGQRYRRFYVPLASLSRLEGLDLAD